MKRAKLVILDGDDTLWRTQELYDVAKAKFVSLLAKHGLKDRNLMAILDRIDADAAATHAFTVSRFTDSMIRTYRSISQARRRHADDDVEKEIKLLGDPLLGDYKLYPDTLEALEQLAGRYALVLATKGQPDLQGQKVRRLHLERFFDRIYLLERKTEKEYLDILREHQLTPDAVWTIGNSVRSDINPALELGMRAVLIWRPTWQYEEAKLKPGDVTVVDSLGAASGAILARDLDESPAPTGTQAY